ncbi:hypothetical protein DFJ63DRAFT_144313 [Scheffersomyces coipomensis]|uniref:uncharacterized protein n=1 Tax=Scheffersomyces coipomensis TaxID=1788519 RepID=UPI00315CDA3F
MPVNPLPQSITTGTTTTTNHSTDEDWSIISSSSDVDDDRSTVSDDIDREHDPLNLVENNHHNNIAAVTPDFTNSSVSSFNGSFRLPNSTTTPMITPSESDKQSIKKNSVSTIIAVADVPPIAAVIDDDKSKVVTSNKSSSSSTTTTTTTTTSTKNIGNKIKFYENLSKINESIKQSSNQFYSSYAKSKIQEWNDYIIESTDSLNNIKLTSTTTTTNNIIPPSLNDDSNLEDTIELVDQTVPSVKSISTLSSTESENNNLTTTKSSSSLPPPPPPLPTNNFLIIDKRYIQSLLLQAVQFLQAFMESNSQYLYYYLFGAIIVSLVPTYYLLTSTICLIQSTTKSMCNCSQPIPPPSLLDSLSPQIQDKIIEIYNLYDNLVYEVEPPVKSFLFFSQKAKKTNKLSKFIRAQTNDIDWDQFYLLQQNLIDFMKISQTKFDRFSKETFIIVDKQSKLGLKYGIVGANKLIEMSKFGMDELINQTNLLNQYIKDQQPLDKIQIYIDQSKILILKNIEIFKQSSIKQNLDLSAITIHDKFVEYTQYLFGPYDQLTKDLIVL